MNRKKKVKTTVEEVHDAGPYAGRCGECGGAEAGEVGEEGLDVVGGGGGGVEEAVLLDGLVVGPVGRGVVAEAHAAAVGQELPGAHAVAAVRERDVRRADQRVRVDRAPHVPAEAAPREHHPLGPAGRPGREEHCRDR